MYTSSGRKNRFKQLHSSHCSYGNVISIVCAKRPPVHKDSGHTAMVRGLPPPVVRWWCDWVVGGMGQRGNEGVSKQGRGG